MPLNKETKPTKPLNHMTVKTNGLFKRNIVTLNHMIVHKLLVFAGNTWNHITVSKEIIKDWQKDCNKKNAREHWKYKYNYIKEKSTNESNFVID